jgi:hypothetical protein
LVNKFERINPASAGPYTEMKMFAGRFACGPDYAYRLTRFNTVASADKYLAEMPVYGCYVPVYQVNIDPENVVVTYRCGVAVHNCKHGIVVCPQVNTGMKRTGSGDRVDPVAKGRGDIEVF